MIDYTFIHEGDDWIGLGYKKGQLHTGRINGIPVFTANNGSIYCYKPRGQKGQYPNVIAMFKLKSLKYEQENQKEEIQKVSGM